MKLLTIVIPSYNVSQYIGETLRTITDNNLLDLIEVLVIDDGSTDDTKKVALNWQKEYPKTVRVISKINGGHGSTINKGVCEAKGKYFKVIDGDDWVASKNFERFLQELQKTNADVVISPYTIVNMDDHTVSDVKNNELIGSNECDFENALNQIDDVYHMHALTFRTDILKNSKKSITEKCFYVDQEYIMYPFEYIQTFTYIDENVYQYRIGRADQSMNWNKMVQNYKMHEKVLENLIFDYQNCSCSDIKKDFYRKRISKLIRTQYLIYLHDHNIIDGYRKFKKFRNQKMGEIKGEGKVSDALEINNAIYYPMRCAMKCHLIH